MDPRFLNYYSRELKHLRSTAWDFAQEFPKIAGRLSLDEFDCADPYVERLLEGFAFLAARVQLKLDAEFPVFTQAILETVYPHYLSPTPSMTVVQFNPQMAEGALAAGYEIRRGETLRSSPARTNERRVSIARRTPRASGRSRCRKPHTARENWAPWTFPRPPPAPGPDSVSALMPRERCRSPP